MRSCVNLQYVHLGGIRRASHEDKCRPRQTKRFDAMLRQLGSQLLQIPNDICCHVRESALPHTRRCIRYGMSAMPCPEQLRLRQHYEAALRHWGRVILSSDANLVGILARQASEIKRTAFDERNAAKGRLDDHSLTCPTCNPKLRRIGRRLH
jgi:hypothetical protein